MNEIKYNPELSPGENARMAIDAVNALIRDRNAGQGWETRIRIDQTEESVYNSLPTTVQAEMVEEEFNAALAEMEEI